MISYGKMLKGTFVPNNEEARTIALLRLEGKDVQEKITEKKDIRTPRQNALLWAYYTIISKETGDDTNSLHEFFKRKFIPPEIIEVSYHGKCIEIAGSTTNLTKHAFNNYLLNIYSLTGIPYPAKEEYSL